LLLLVATSAQALVLVDNGQPKATIVVAATPSGTVMEAATDLQTYIQRISGAALPIKNEKEAVSGTRILVGQSDAVKGLGVKVPSGFTYQMNEEGFVIKTVGDNLVLAGNEDWHYHGTPYAVYDFLERLGCRWFFPGAYGEVVPKMSTIDVDNLDVLQRPSFRLRNMSFYNWKREGDAASSAEYSTWLLRNKGMSTEGLSLPGDGTITRLAPPEKYFESNPEIYALDRNGQRVKDMLCLTNPETVKIAVKTITDTFRSDPTIFTFAFAPPDGMPVCYCPMCQRELKGFTGKGLGDPSMSDLYFKFVNAIAKEVKKEFPDRWLWTNGYANRVRPPEGGGPLCDNIGIQSAAIAACTFHPLGDPACWQRQDYEEILARWTEMIPCVFIYDYEDGKSLDHLPMATLHCLKHDLPWMNQRGIWGFWTETFQGWGQSQLNFYVRAKLMWDANQDVDSLVRDYCEKFFGKGADPVEDYTWTLEQAVERSPIHTTWGREITWRAILSRQTMETLDNDMQKAQALADTPETQLHARMLSLVNDHTKAFLQMEYAAADGRFREAAECVDEMLRLRAEAGKVDPRIIAPSEEIRLLGHPYSTIEYYRSVWQDMAEKAGGAKGELIALLPRLWEFNLDPNGDGQIYQWYLPDVGGRWRDIDTTLNWHAAGYHNDRGAGYSGKAWYRTSFYVPPEAAGKKLTLTFGGVWTNGIWIWMNGFLTQYLTGFSSKQPFEVDVTGHVNPGAINTIAIMVDRDTLDREQRGGMYRRVILWAPRQTEATLPPTG